MLPTCESWVVSQAKHLWLSVWVPRNLTLYVYYNGGLEHKQANWAAVQVPTSHIFIEVVSVGNDWKSVGCSSTARMQNNLIRNIRMVGNEGWTWCSYGALAVLLMRFLVFGT